MSDPTIKKIVCHGCHAVLDATDNYCRRCGEPTVILAERGGAKPRMAPQAFDPADRPPGRLESPWVVLPMLFLVFGPLALPLLWRSRQFTLLWKNVLTAIMVVLTVFLLWSVWFSLQQALEPLRELEKIRGL
jgi:hypothetical protein